LLRLGVVALKRMMLMLKSHFRRLIVKLLLAIGFRVTVISRITGFSKVTVYKIKKTK
jgi:hypothetical protein